MPDLDLGDIQGLIPRSYAMPAARHFVLRIDHAERARSFIGNLVSGDSASSPQVTTALPWTVKPDYCLNLGFTYEGLKSVELPASSLASFPDEFVEGAAARAERIGDTGDSAPENWIGKLGTSDAHVLLSLFAQRREILESVTIVLRLLFARSGALTELSHHDGNALPGDVAHFGYKDGFSQPTIAGGPPAGLPDPLPLAPAGEFLLGYESQNVDYTYPVPRPEDKLGHNGSFVAFRILQQDVDGFEKFLQENAPKAGMSVEKLAAKVCGRWRNGVPLVLSPDSPDKQIAPDQMNNFDYMPDDELGYRCPIGSHIRRANPRSARVAGNGGLLHRIIRRGLPYGPPYDPSTPNDGIERGLLGMFIGVSILDQFEFLMREWFNNGAFAAGLGRSKDPILGDNAPEASRFVIPAESGDLRLTGFSRFVKTRGSAYCFLPSMTAMRYIAKQ